jgi:SAM-dependent methyltransferase
LEVTNFLEISHTGHVWFGLDSAEKMVDWIEENVEKNKKIVDIGSGNGHLVFSLLELGFTNAFGVDYSENSIKLSNSIAQSRNIEAKFMLMDILDPMQTGAIAPVDVFLDKGTFDAISLAPASEGEHPANIYVKAVYNAMDEFGILLITSCNWTESELLQRFQQFRVKDRIKYPTFQFGGKTGQKVTTLALVKNPVFNRC